MIGTNISKKTHLSFLYEGMQLCYCKSIFYMEKIVYMKTPLFWWV